MRALVRTRRQARQRLLVAFNAIDDVFALTKRDVAHRVIPAAAVGTIAIARSYVRAARASLNHTSNNGK